MVHRILFTCVSSCVFTESLKITLASAYVLKTQISDLLEPCTHIKKLTLPRAPAPTAMFLRRGLRKHLVRHFEEALLGLRDYLAQLPQLLAHLLLDGRVSLPRVLLSIDGRCPQTLAFPTRMIAHKPSAGPDLVVLCRVVCGLAVVDRAHWIPRWVDSCFRRALDLIEPKIPLVIPALATPNAHTHTEYKCSCNSLFQFVCADAVHELKSFDRV